MQARTVTEQGGLFAARLARAFKGGFVLFPYSMREDFFCFMKAINLGSRKVLSTVLKLIIPAMIAQFINVL